MDYLYLRCDGRDTLDGAQLALLSAHSPDKAFLERKEGRHDALSELVAQLGEGDCLIAESFSAVADSSADFLSLIGRLVSRGAAFRFLREDVDTREQTELRALFEALLSLDKKYRQERRREGIERAKEAGRYRGRRPIEIDDARFDETVARWQRGELTAKQAMKELGLKPNTFYRRVKAREEREAPPPPEGAQEEAP